MAFIRTLLFEIIELSKIKDFETSISLNQVLDAKKLINNTPKTTEHLFQILCAMNLLNAALKDKQFQHEVYYGMLKPRVSKLLHYILEESKLKFDVKYYINQQENCVYIEVEMLQFSFHNITIDEKLQDFINSPPNKVQKWKGLRLQKIAGELFDYAVN